MTKQPQTEQELADFYQAHKDDPELWSDPVPAPPRKRGRPGRGLAARITVRFTPEEAAMIYRVAEAEGLVLAEAVRQAVRAYADPTGAASKSGSR
jgi:hypothetical protein